MYFLEFTVCSLFLGVKELCTAPKERSMRACFLAAALAFAAAQSSPFTPKREITLQDCEPSRILTVDSLFVFHGLTFAKFGIEALDYLWSGVSITHASDVHQTPIQLIPGTTLSILGDIVWETFRRNQSCLWLSPFDSNVHVMVPDVPLPHHISCRVIFGKIVVGFYPNIRGSVGFLGANFQVQNDLEDVDENLPVPSCVCAVQTL